MFEVLFVILHKLGLLYGILYVGSIYTSLIITYQLNTNNFFFEKVTMVILGWFRTFWVLWEYFRVYWELSLIHI